MTPEPSEPPELQSSPEPPSPPPPDTSGGDGPLEVLVVAYGSPDLLDECLGALGNAYPVVVVDNSSSPATRQVVESHSARYVDAGANLGFAGGVNLGLDHRAHPDGDVLLLNPDARVTGTDVGRLQRRLHSDDRLAGVAPAQIDPSDGATARVEWPFPTPAGVWIEAVGLGRLRRRPGFLIGSVLLLRAEALREIGRFDDRFFLYAEETDWQRRAADRGWRMAVCPEVTATHLGAGTGGDSAERELHFHASHERYIRKHYGTPGWWIYRTGVMVGAAGRALVLPGARGRAEAARFQLYRQGPRATEDRDRDPLRS